MIRRARSPLPEALRWGEHGSTSAPDDVVQAGLIGGIR